jgi:Protein of unknown function (DUF3160)
VDAQPRDRQPRSHERDLRARFFILLSQKTSINKTLAFSSGVFMSLNKDQTNKHRIFSYSPLATRGLSLLSAEVATLSEEQCATLAKHGFVICRDRFYPNFVEGYAALFKADLPVFISADVLLNALHWSFSRILEGLEQTHLAPALSAMVGALRARLASGVSAQWGQQETLDVYLTVAQRLSLGEPPGSCEESEGGLIEELDVCTGLSVTRQAKRYTPPLFAQSQAQVDALLQKIAEASGLDTVSLFGLPRKLDFSLFTPRGNYDKETQYFGLVCWLRFAELRFCWVEPSGEWALSRNCLYAALALRELFDEDARRAWSDFTTTLSSLLGSMDGLSLSGLERLFAWLGEPTREQLEAMSDDTLLQKLLTFPEGRQAVSSAPIFVQRGQVEPPLPLSFSLVGGVSAPESKVMGSLVFNRVGRGELLRMMPNPLDVAYAVFQNDLAAELLKPELARYPYQEDLEEARRKFSQETDNSLRAAWIRVLQSLSPTQKQEVYPRSRRQRPSGGACCRPSSRLGPSFAAILFYTRTNRGPLASSALFLMRMWSQIRRSLRR